MAIAEGAKARLVCPVCKGGLAWRDADAVAPVERVVECVACARVYPFHDGIPVLLRERAVPKPTP